MADDFELPEEYDFDEDVALDPDEKDVGGTREEWLKMTHKNQMVRCAFVYFHTCDKNAVRAALKAGRKEGKKLTKDEVLEVENKSLTARAEELSKKLDQLTDVDKLDVTVAHFKAMKAHYQEGLGYVLSRLGKDGAEADLIWKRLPEPKMYFSTLLLIYPTDSEGALNKEELARQIKEKKLKLVPWRFSTRVYDDIWKLNDGLRENNLSLASQDIKLECKEVQYQNISVQFAGAALWQKNDQFKAVVLEAAINMYEKLIPFREMTTDQLRAKLGLGGSATEDISSDSFQDMLDQV
jgi:hypothetical protein